MLPVKRSRVAARLIIPAASFTRRGVGGRR